MPSLVPEGGATPELSAGPLPETLSIAGHLRQFLHHIIKVGIGSIGNIFALAICLQFLLGEDDVSEACRTHIRESFADKYNDIVISALREHEIPLATGTARAFLILKGKPEHQLRESGFWCGDKLCVVREKMNSFQPVGCQDFPDIHIESIGDDSQRITALLCKADKGVKRFINREFPHVGSDFVGIEGTHRLCFQCVTPGRRDLALTVHPDYLITALTPETAEERIADVLVRHGSIEIHEKPDCHEHITAPQRL
jgi:hypothetical protein